MTRKTHRQFGLELLELRIDLCESNIHLRFERCEAHIHHRNRHQLRVADGHIEGLSERNGGLGLEMRLVDQYFYSGCVHCQGLVGSRNTAGETGRHGTDTRHEFDSISVSFCHCTG